MGKRKNKEQRNKFAECIDPRFSGIFNSKIIDEKKNGSESIQVFTKTAEHQVSNGSLGFQNFISAKLTEYLDKHTKEVDRSALDNDFFKNKFENIHIFSNSGIISKEQPIESVPQKRPKKKKQNKDRIEKESLKEMAVTFDFIQRQAEIFNS